MRKKTAEEYIETIFEFELNDGHAHTGQIAERLGVKPPSVTEMLQKLKAEGLVRYSAYTNIKLTKKGNGIAQDLASRHKAIADFLQVIGVEGAQAQKDACQIEHHVSKMTTTQLKRFVEFVEVCPQSPMWLEHYKEYSKSGRRRQCCKK